MPHVWQAFEWLENNFELFSEYKSMIYVGHRHDTKMWWIDKFCKSLLKIEKIAVLEIFQKNFENAISRLATQNVLVILGDIKKFDEYFKKDEYDIVFWDEGPEHVEEEELKPIMQKIKDNCKCAIFSVPWGKWPQKAEGENDAEEHRYDAMPEHFTNLGMTVQTFNSPDATNSGAMIAYWRKK